ncbi:MAG TPA: FtsQ-type POTRA domain-containing protein [Abditibacterium sp.]
MSQPPSPYSPDSQDSPRETTPRRLVSPAERFAPPPPVTLPIAPDPFVPEPTTRRDDEMARRHLPPRERRRHERTLKKREKRDANRRMARENTHHTQRASVERDFALRARQEAPQTAAKTRRRVPVWLKRLFFLVAVLFLGQLGFAALTAPQFEIKTIAIAGADVTPENEIEALAAPLRGQNIVRVDHKKVEKAVQTLPTVASAHVVRLASWPPKVELQIVEREPLLKVGAGDDWWVADKTGVPFRRPTSEDFRLYSVVAPDFEPQLREKLEPKVWARVAELNAAIRADNLLARPQGEASEDWEEAGNEPFWVLRRIYFDKNGLASLRVSGKGNLRAHNELLLRLGDDKWSEKLARARVALSYFERTGRRAAELDLISLERPVWRPITPQIAAKNGEDSASQNSG